MARKARVEFAGALYHVLDRGDRLEAIFRDAVDRARFKKNDGRKAALAATIRVHTAFPFAGLRRRGSSATLAE